MDKKGFLHCRTAFFTATQKKKIHWKKYTKKHAICPVILTLYYYNTISKQWTILFLHFGNICHTAIFTLPQDCTFFTATQKKKIQQKKYPKKN
jgi:hypothetical protein